MRWACTTKDCPNKGIVITLDTAGEVICGPCGNLCTVRKGRK